jgi:hypothetical protein
VHRLPIRRFCWFAGRRWIHSSHFISIIFVVIYWLSIIAWLNEYFQFGAYLFKILPSATMYLSDWSLKSECGLHCSNSKMHFYRTWWDPEFWH